MSGCSQVCTIYLGDEVFAIPIDKVREMVPYHHLTTVPRSPGSIEGLMNLRSQVITVLNLHHDLQIERRIDPYEMFQVILHHAPGLVGLMVDEVGDIMKVDKHDLVALPASLPKAAAALMQGAYMLEGQLLLLLDCSAIACMGKPNER
ncbi:MAG: chemotaxis protein CheW [Mariprofundus sp.]|nr:chemotaxis protein CheW [Mariprofundus sp.]